LVQNCCGLVHLDQPESPADFSKTCCGFLKTGLSKKPQGGYLMSKITDLNTLIEGFRLYCLAEGKQPTTIRWYMGKLNIFQRYLKDHDLPTDASQITTTHLRQFLVYLKTQVRADEHNPHKPARDEGLSPQTIQGYARTLKAFFSWATIEGYLAQNPTQRLRIPKAPKAIIETFSDDQIHRLLRVIDQRSAVGFRDHCIILVFLDTGIRLSELVTLELPNLHLDQAYFKVMGKGAKERIVPIGAHVQKAMWKYIHQYRPEPFHPNIQNVFLTRDGRALSCNNVYQRILLPYTSHRNLRAGSSKSPGSVR
jgi:site-specific recombinase XerD